MKLPNQKGLSPILIVISVVIFLIVGGIAVINFFPSSGDIEITVDHKDGTKDFRKDGNTFNVIDCQKTGITIYKPKDWYLVEATESANPNITACYISRENNESLDPTKGFLIIATRNIKDSKPSELAKSILADYSSTVLTKYKDDYDVKSDDGKIIGYSTHYTENISSEKYVTFKRFIAFDQDGTLYEMTYSAPEKEFDSRLSSVAIMLDRFESVSP